MKEFPQALGLSAADRDLSLFLIVQAQLVRALEPGNDFFDPVNVYQVRSMGAPKQIGVKAIQQFFKRAAVGLSFHAAGAARHDANDAVLAGSDTDVFSI